MKKVKRLYREFKPEHYELYLEPDREKKTFAGRVKIVGQKTGKPSYRITLHQKDLKVSRAQLTYKDKRGHTKEIGVDRVNTHSGFDELRLHAKEILYPGAYTLELEFSGKITEAMHGIYPCNFKYKGRNKQLIATQFESHHAREAFPCIDEPEAKATFDLTLKTPDGETVLANTPIKSQTKKDDRLLTRFEVSPKMSPYLLAFAYGEMVSVSGKTKGSVSIGCYGSPLATGMLDYSLRAAIKSVEFFEDYFGVAYPLSKLDMIALPDFSSGAMENWGLITYRESVMLVDPKNTAVETKQLASLVIAHEISHQWFGNLVTMRWWDDLWLNESFANLMEYRAVEQIHPEWNILEQFVNGEMNIAMRRDALSGVQPVRVEVKHPDEIGSLFDPAIVYAKGGNILHMLMNHIGEEAFREGLAAYFKKHAYDNTSADDLWMTLSEASGKDVGKFMDNWLNKPGYPVVSVNLSGSNSLELEQTRLTIGKSASSKTIWQVPLASNTELERATLTGRNAAIKVGKPAEPLLLNHEGRSYFIPRYRSPKHLEEIVGALKLGRIGTIDRLLLLMHGSILETAGLVGTVDNLNLAGALQEEKDEPVWAAMAGITGSARRLVGMDKGAEAKLNNFVRDLTKQALKRVSWSKKTGDTAQDERLRNLILSLAAGAQNPDVLKEGKRLYARFEQPFDLAPDIRGTVYFIGVRFGEQADFDKLLKLYKTTDNAEEKDEIASALTSTREPSQIKTLVDMLNSKHVRPQDLPRWFAWLIRNQYAADQAWSWLKNNWRYVEEKYGDDKSFDAFPRYSSMVFSREDELKEYKGFFGPKRTDPALTRVIDLGIEEIDGRVTWRAQNEQAVRDWLTRF